MRAPQVDRQRSIALFIVVAVHATVIAMFMLRSPTAHVSPVRQQSIEVSLLPPSPLPPIVAESSRPKALRLAQIVVAPPSLESLSLPQSSFASDKPASMTDGQGTGVDWNAEAHRAIHAFEIRNRQPKDGISVSGTPAEEHWWRRLQHRAGDRFKTPNGDWIVWIDANCYQVASSQPNTYALSGALPQTICVADKQDDKH
jgi:hypothetical protein